jgi:phosphatidylinositol glycan class B
MFLSGIFLGFSCVIHFSFLIQLVPIFLYLISIKHKKYLFYFLSGILVIFVIEGFLDLFFYGSFLKSIFSFIDYDVIQNKSAGFGTSPFYYYFTEILKNWGFSSFFFLLIPLSKQKSKQVYDFFIDLILIPLFTFSIIPHKEYRFIFLIIPFLLLLIANVVASFKKKYFYLAVFLLIFSSMITIFNMNFSPKRELCSAEQWVGKKNDLTGLIIFDTWAETCGYTYLHKNVPIAFFPPDIPAMYVIQINSPEELDYVLEKNITFNYIIFSYEKSLTIKAFEESTGINFIEFISNKMDKLVKEGKFIEVPNEFKNIKIFKRVQPQ